MPRVTDLLGGRRPDRAAGAADDPDRRSATSRASRWRSRPTATCGCRTSRAATKASCSRSAIRPSAATAARIRSPARSGSARSRSSSSPRSSASRCRSAAITVTECQMVNQFKGSASEPPHFTRGYGLVFGHCERKAMAMALVDRALRARELGEEIERAGAGRGVRAVAFRQRPGDRLRRAPEAAALCRLPGRAGSGAPHARRDRRSAATMSRSARRPNERADLQLRLSRRADQADDPPRDPQGDRDSRLSGAVRQPRDADALRLGHRRRAGDGVDPRAATTS